MLGRRGRHDVATALALVMMLGLGALFLSLSVEYAPEVYSLLFGEVLGITRQPARARRPRSRVVCVAAIVAAVPPADALLGAPRGRRGARRQRLRDGAGFLAVVALATTMTVPVVGTLLIFSLMIGAPGGRALASPTGRCVAMALSVAIALIDRLERDRRCPTRPTIPSASSSARSAPPPTRSGAAGPPGGAAQAAPAGLVGRHPGASTIVT